MIIHSIVNGITFTNYDSTFISYSSTFISYGSTFIDPSLFSFSGNLNHLNPILHDLCTIIFKLITSSLLFRTPFA